MLDAATIAQLNGGYQMPEDAGPAWRAAAAIGMDMALIEEQLALSPSERLARNDGFVALARTLQKGQRVDHGTVDRPA